jgi:hypothetical protein
VVRLEHIVSLLCGALQDDDHEAPHQECTVYHFFGLFGSAIVEHTVVVVIFVAQESGEFPSVSMYHSQIKWAEILVEWHVSQIVVDVEEKGLFVVLRWFVISDPIKFF